MDDFFLFLGRMFCMIGGLLLSLSVIGLLGYIAGCIWAIASDRWRLICKAESLIFEYRKKRSEFLEWKKGGGDHP